MKPAGPSSSSIASRLLPALALLPLVACLLLFLVLAVIPLVLRNSGATEPGDWLILTAFVLLPVGLTIGLRRIAPLRWRLALGYAAVAPVLAYLAVDDPALRHPTSLSEVAPAFPGAEKSFAVLMRYGKSQPLGRDFKAPQRIFRQGRYVDASKPEEWVKWLAEHRADIEADWADLAPVRAWWDELAAFDRIGDLTPGRIDAEIMAFSPVRSYAQHAVAIAGLQALDGRGDEAFATLQPLLEVSRRLEPSSRTLVRFMIARVIQRMAIDAAGFVLDRTPVSPSARARFAAALVRGSGGEAGARRLIGIEYAFGLDAFASLRLGDFLHAYVRDQLGALDLRRELPFRLLNPVSPLAFNPRLTFNVLGDLTARRQDLAARRQTDRLAELDKAFFAHEGRPRFKNLLGAIFISQTTPALTKVTETYWKIEDLRLALAGRLGGL